MSVIDDSTEMVHCVNITVDEVLVLNTYILVCLVTGPGVTCRYYHP